jgi:hypothetical protein
MSAPSGSRQRGVSAPLTMKAILTHLPACLLRLEAVKLVSPPRQLPRLPFSSLTAPTHSDPSTSMFATRLEAVKDVSPSR